VATATHYLRHVRLERPLDLRIDGRARRGVVLKRAPEMGT
jgi:hypothetical protein